MTGCYNYISITILHAAFYCCLEPWILVMALVSVVLMYLVKKYLILRRYCTPNHFHRLVFETALLGLSFAPLMFGSGSLLFVLLLSSSYEVSLIVPCALIIVVSVVNIANPCGVFDKLGKTLH